MIDVLLLIGSILLLLLGSFVYLSLPFYLGTQMSKASHGEPTVGYFAWLKQKDPFE